MPRISPKYGRVPLGARLAIIAVGVMSKFIGSTSRVSSALRWAVAGVAVTGLSIAGLGGTARAADVQVAGSVSVGGPAAPGVVATGTVAPTAEENMIPPGVEGAPVAAQGGGYCYGGPHPAPGGGWEAIATPHTHNYAPFDMRLFQYHQGCYYFIGDPRDFGYTGQTYSYYGAHPIADVYGGGWCFMVGPHYHWWRPWSSYFTVVGPWYYWGGPYDPFFWAYWPYYSFYYRSYYPAYYAGGRYYRSGYRVAPPITRVPPTGWRGTPPGGATAGGWRGTPTTTQTSPLRAGSPAGGGWRGAPGAATPTNGTGWHAAPPAAGGGWRGGGAPPASGWHGGGAPTFGAPGGGWHGAPGGGGWHPPSSGSGWHGGGGGAFRGGGGFRGRH
jgi:hypothetical protein